MAGTNGIVPTPKTDVINATEVISFERNPAAIFLASKALVTRKDYQADLNTISKLLGAENAFTCNWAALRYTHTQAIRTRLQEIVSEHTGNPLSPGTINHMLIAMRGILKTTWRLGLISGDDYQRAIDIDGVKGETLPAGRELSKGEMIALLEDCENDPTNAGIRDAAIIALAYSCGLRRAEIVALNLDDYDSESGRLVICGKRSKQRTAYLVNGAKKAMEDWLAIRGDGSGAIFLAIDKVNRIRYNRNLSPQAVYNILAKRGKNANVADFSPHDMRRTFVSDLLDAGADIATIAKMAGHASVVTTARYDRRPEAIKIRAAELLYVPYRGRNGKRQLTNK